jgi:arginyl-tRNA synthetase
VPGHDFGHADQVVNVIDVRQAHPQAIVRAALELTRAALELSRAATDGPAAPVADEAVLHHLAYEVVTLEGQAMSGRKGVTLAIDDVLEEAVRRARAVVVEKQPDLPEIDAVARAVGVGALRFAMLKSEAKRVIDFRWEQALSLAGDSAPYVQYAHARAGSILRAATAAGLAPASSEAPDAGWSALGSLEVRLARVVARYPDVVRAAAHDDAPHVVAQYALDLATAWNGYYNHRGADGRPDTAVLKSPPGLREARLALVRRVRDTLARSLGLLGIEAPEQM